MTFQRICIAQFCDDIRREVGNKYSLIGCYSDELIVDAVPTALPKFCARARIISDLKEPFKKLTLKAILGDEVVAELDIPAADLEKGQEALLTKIHGERISVIAMIVLSPLFIKEESRLRIDAETENGVLRGSTILIRQRTAQDPPI